MGHRRGIACAVELLRGAARRGRDPEDQAPGFGESRVDLCGERGVVGVRGLVQVLVQEREDAQRQWGLCRPGRGQAIDGVEDQVAVVVDVERVGDSVEVRVPWDLAARALGAHAPEDASVTLGAANFETGRNAVTAIAVGDALKVVRISAEQTATQINTDIGAAVAAYALVFDSTVQRGVLVHDADWSSAGGRARVATLDNVTSLAALQALTAAAFAEMD